MATCSSDMCVKIWKKAAPEAGIPSNYSMSSPPMSDDDGIMSSTQSGESSADVESQMVNGAKWINTHKIQAHNGPVWKVSWADPHFGQVSLSAESVHAESYHASKF